jgi:hypothetical protein
MKTIVFVAYVLVCALSLDAQLTPSLSRNPDGFEEMRVRNNSAVSLVAFVVSAKHLARNAADSDEPIVMFFDAIEPETGPLLPGEERVIAVRGRPLPSEHFFEEPMITAGIFADGTTTGDAVLLARLVTRRSNMLLAVETALETLSEAGRRNVPRDQLIAQFNKMADSLNRWYLPPEQQVGHVLYQSITGKLMNLPEQRAGAPFPPAAFVAEETAMLRQRRVSLLESQPSLANGAFTR